MPITPHFVLSQSLTHVTVDIRVPHVRVSVQSVQVVVDGPSLHFSSSPYLLVLTFPAPLVGDESECATYDPSRDGGTITLKLMKQEPAIWPDLDLMGALLTPKKTRTRGAAIEILDESTLPQTDDDSKNEESELLDLKNVRRPHYGFLDLYSGIFTDLAREGLAAEMLQLPDPDVTNAEERRAMRLLAEEEAFDPDRYLGDLDVDDDYIFQTAMSMTPHWQNAVDAVTQQLSELAMDDNGTHSYFTPEEAAKLASISYPLLPNDISVEHEESLFLGLLDILFAYVYDHLMTDGDPTSESSWTVCTLSSTLSWLDTFSTKDSFELVVRHSIRRALIYPYLRNYELATYCWKQVCCIVRNGRRCVIRSLLQVRNILDKSEWHYLGNRLYIDPYLAWIQRQVKPAKLAFICDRLDKLLQDGALQKNSLDLNLMELERQLDNPESSNDSGSESDDDESTDEEATDSDDSNRSSTRDEISPCVAHDSSGTKVNSTELLEFESGNERIGTVKLNNTRSSTREALIEEL